jgi:endonuclease/exonuclease/phosphatase family metal-dependent hydrolase
VFLQEVRSFHHREARAASQRTSFGWPDQGQADFLAPEGYAVAYRTNAVTRHGEHGNALLSRWPHGRHRPPRCVSDHRFEQRGLLHVPVQWAADVVHAVVAHLGLIHASRVRQVQRLAEPSSPRPNTCPRRAAGGGRRLQRLGREARRRRCADGPDARAGAAGGGRR